MSHVFTVPDEDYTRLEAVARKRGATVAQLFEAWVGSVTIPNEFDATFDTTEGLRIRSAPRHWAALNPDAAPLAEEELREHPLLQAMGTFASGAPGWADRHKV